MRWSCAHSHDHPQHHSLCLCVCVCAPMIAFFVNLFKVKFLFTWSGLIQLSSPSSFRMSTLPRSNRMIWHPIGVANSDTFGGFIQTHCPFIFASRNWIELREKEMSKKISNKKRNKRKREKERVRVKRNKSLVIWTRACKFT